jgi:hypothetical protein
METIEKQVKDQIESLNEKFAQEENVKEFEKTNDQFEELVSKGVAKKRGYNLLSATDAHIKNQVWFNAK